MPISYRIAKAKHSQSAAKMLSGEGGLFAGARWHSRGHRMVYTASSISLATLEIAVHLSGTSLIPSYSMLKLDIPEDIIIDSEILGLPEGWDKRGTPPPIAQDIGNGWYESAFSCVMCVPSVIVPTEMNYLINPEHVDFDKIEILSGPDAYPFDERIKA